MMPDIRHRQRNVFRKRARSIYSDATGVGAKVPPSGETIAAATADYMAFTADDFTGEKVAHIAAYLEDFSHELVPNHHWDGDGFLRPGVPFVDMKVSTADACPPDFDQDVVDPALWFGNV